MKAAKPSPKREDLSSKPSRASLAPEWLFSPCHSLHVTRLRVTVRLSLRAFPLCHCEPFPTVIASPSAEGRGNPLTRRHDPLRSREVGISHTCSVDLLSSSH